MSVYSQYNHRLYPNAQLAYSVHRSTEAALLKVKNDILLNMNKQHITLLVPLDLSAAFDTVQRNILLEALNTLGLGGRVSKWFRSYLSGRSQRILVRGCLSKRFDLNYGVPQGSCLGPLLFTIYTSSLLDVVEKYLPSVHCYADDTLLYVSFRPADETGHLDTITAIDCCIKAIRCWMRENKLLLNVEKTEFLLIGTKQQLAKVDIGHIIKVGKVNIAPHSPVKNLGVWFDSNLSMVDHITKTCSAAFHYLCNIRRIRKYLTKECTETLIHVFISSRLVYCNSLLFGVPECHLHKLQSPECSCTPYILGEQILSYHTSAQIITLAACKISHSF